MSVDREELKRLIDHMHEDDTAEVFDFIGYLKVKREREAINQLDVESFSVDQELIQQVRKSQLERENGEIYDKERGFEYLNSQLEEYERGQDL
ncbi:hypothetical protein [Lentibacillus saliphilus]|uniref:hypothetical protein n=1 Tax=Lentibacillus saliphilus TaxID=2737028 RepID=UPI001C3109A6